MMQRLQEKDIISIHICYEGEPTWVKISGDIEEFTQMIWNNLNADNKVSLFVRYIDIATGEYETRIINKNVK